MPDEPPDERSEDQPLHWPAADRGADSASGGESDASAEAPSEPLIDYPQLVQEALRDVPRAVLEKVSREGLAGEHHFYISFRTQAPGVHLPSHLLAQHPEDMTIILQRQFWDLYVDAEAFSVTLSFGGARQSLTVPFSALSTFVDPSVPFGLRWQEEGPEALPDGEEPAAEEPAEQEASEAPEPAAAEEAPPAEPGKVLRIDRFRSSDD